MPALCGPPVRQLGRATGRWPRHSAGRGGGISGEHFELQLRAPGRHRIRAAPDGPYRCCTLTVHSPSFSVRKRLHHLGVPTTRALSLVRGRASRWSATCSTTATRLERRDCLSRGARVHPLRALQALFASRGEHALLQQLIDFTITHYLPAIAASTRTDQTDAGVVRGRVVAHGLTSLRSGCAWALCTA